MENKLKQLQKELDTTNANYGKFFNIDIISFILGIGATLTLGVISQYGIKKMQQK